MVSQEYDNPSTPVHHRRTSPKTMWSFNSLSPRKLKEQGDQYVFKAQILLDDRGAESTQSRCQQAQERLVM